MRKTVRVMPVQEAEPAVGSAGGSYGRAPLGGAGGSSVTSLLPL